MIKNKETDLIIFSLLFFVAFSLRRLSFNDKITVSIFILFILIYSIYFCIKYKQNKIYLIGAGFAFAADIFLSIIREGNGVIETGLTLFLCAQIAFMFFMNRYNKKKVKTLTIYRIAISLALAAIAVIIFNKNTNYLIILTCVYGVNLIINLIEAIQIRKVFPLLYVGFVLFILCDIAIGLNAAKDLGIIDLSNIPFVRLAFLIDDCGWIFYMPCQGFMCVSLMINNTQKDQTEVLN